MAPSDLVTRDPEILGGIPVFRGTRVPVQTFLDYLDAGETLDSFLDDFPSVERSQTHKIIGWLKGALLEQAA